MSAATNTRFTPWQIIVAALSTLYAGRHLDSIIGLGSPEPLARLYSRSYYRATWITTGLDAGHATAMNIQPKWLRDLAAMAFSAYYVIYANEADDKLRKYRATASIEMLRTCWEKTSKNPWIRAITYFERPRLPVMRKMVFPRQDSDHPFTVYLYFAKPEQELGNQRELILDFPGGGFICMSPLDHEERLRRWAIKTGRPVLAVDYHKAPEFPYPFAIDESFELYKLIVESKGKILGMAGDKLSVIMSGDSASALASSQGHIPGLEEMKDHFSGGGPLDVAGPTDRGRKSWTGESVKGRTEGTGRFPSRPASPVRKRTTPLGSPTIGRRVRLWEEPMGDIKPEAPARKTIGTRLTMTSRTGFFQDRIISPSMMRAMAILYIGPKNNPDFKTDYRISPLLAPSALLAEFPPLLMTCGEKDPFVDDTQDPRGKTNEEAGGIALWRGTSDEQKGDRGGGPGVGAHAYIRGLESWIFANGLVDERGTGCDDDIAGWVVDSFEQARTRALEREREEEAEMLTFTRPETTVTTWLGGQGDAGYEWGVGECTAPGPAVESALTTSRRGRLSTSTPLTSLTEEELMRRRRVEAVEGISEPTPVIDGSALVEEEEGAAEEMRIAYGF
ncbi:Alpha beta-hydrolase [Rhizoctonia solani]|uniref:Alpha beta-hydrolase n=1 Tax=Rhizoctonia solani TaxID=456999 RepID=A0A8H7M6B5_9AGAM|nr:Alpha beta-hydrolase [Rhizoctonia solani]